MEPRNGVNTLSPAEKLEKLEKIKKAAQGSFKLTRPFENDTVSSKPQIEWNPLAEANTYLITVSNNIDCSDPFYTMDNLTGTSFRIPDLSVGSAYLCLSARTEVGTVDASNTGIPITIKKGWYEVVADHPEFSNWTNRSVWTGTEVLVWVGFSGLKNKKNKFYAYNPRSNQWRALSMKNAPTNRVSPSMVWTGERMILWGGTSPSLETLNDGGIYNPSTNSWEALPAEKGPALESHSAAWTGSRMITCGGGLYGNTKSLFYSFDPLTLTWTKIQKNSKNCETWHGASFYHKNKFYSFGGYNIEELPERHNGFPGFSVFDFSLGEWSDPISTNEPAPRSRPTFTSDGLGGAYLVGYHTGQVKSDPLDVNFYDINTNHWTAIDTTHGPAIRLGHGAVWTGEALLIYGGTIIWKSKLTQFQDMYLYYP